MWYFLQFSQLRRARLHDKSKGWVIIKPGQQWEDGEVCTALLSHSLAADACSTGYLVYKTFLVPCSCLHKCQYSYVVILSSLCNARATECWGTTHKHICTLETMRTGSMHFLRSIYICRSNLPLNWRRSLQRNLRSTFNRCAQFARTYLHMYGKYSEVHAFSHRF